ncbi:MarR family transcriptional regulator [Candidatus Microgenomates bacterium]|nr:MarR family transcriptional regulator [Candidatus Microgenomates bacterium]
MKKSLSQNELALILYLSPASVVTLIDELEKLGLVKREIPSDDRRRYSIVLTKKGQRKAIAIRDLTYKLDDFLKDKLQARHNRSFHLNLNKIDHYLDQWKGGEK